MYELSIKDCIASAHYLRGYDGPCKDMHGHTWTVEITVVSDQLDDVGLVVDFREMKKKLKGFLEQVDHVTLNDLPFFKEHNPSTENLARYIYQGFSGQCAPLILKQVRVWESENASITYFE